MLDLLHFSLDEIGASVLAPIGFMNDELGEDSVVLWDDPEDDRSESADTFEVRRLPVEGMAGLELCVPRLGRVSRWTGDIEVVADGIVCESRFFRSDGDGGPMEGFVAIVPLTAPVALRAEWKLGDDRLEEMLSIAASTRFLSPLDQHQDKSSVSHIDFRMSMTIPVGWNARVAEDFVEITGPGSRWNLSRSFEESMTGSTEVLFDDVTVIQQLGIGKYTALVSHTGQFFTVVGQGDDLSALADITRSLRFHQFIDQVFDGQI